MDTRSRTKTEYKVRYGVDHNAALKPQYIAKPAQKKTQAKKQPSARALHKLEVKKYTAIAMVVVFVALGAFCLVSRHAMIYSNTTEIRRLAKEKVELQLQLNSVEKSYSEVSEFTNYLEVAQSELNMVYPENDEIIQVVCPPKTSNEQTQTTEEINIYDSVLDWINALFRGNNSWA